MPSILDLPEPQRSQALGREGMTEEEFRRHMEGWKATIASEEPGAGLHYDEDKAPGFVVVNSPEE